MITLSVYLWEFPPFPLLLKGNRLVHITVALLHVTENDLVGCRLGSNTVPLPVYKTLGLLPKSLSLT